MRLGIAVGGGLVFVGSLLYFLWRYLLGFDEPAATGALAPALFNTGLFTLFALHHTLFARTGLKAIVARVVPPSLERSVYVWGASVLFIVVCAAWRPVPGGLWDLEGVPHFAMHGIQLAGIVFILAAVRRLDALDLAGIRQASDTSTVRSVSLDESGPYGIVRHPIYLGWILLVWADPVMNGTRLVFAGVSTLYLLAAIPFEERDLHRHFGKAYAAYASRVRWRVLPGLY